MFVETHSLAKHYGHLKALDDCTFGVARGEVFGLLGPNGSGKTTLIRLLMGYLRPTGGRALVDQLDCCRQSLRVRQRVAYLPGDVRLFRPMRARDVLDFFARVRPGGDVARLREFAARLQLDLTRRVALMSTGMRQKLGLAVTLAFDTPLLILDEPTSNLDPTVRRDVIRMVDEARDQGRTVIFSSHVLSEVEEVCDRVVILRDGRLVHTQDMSHLRRQHRIRLRLDGEMSLPPSPLAGQLKIHKSSDGGYVIETPDELSPLLGWLSTLPMSEVQIEPVGLRAVYDQFHSGPDHMP